MTLRRICFIFSVLATAACLAAGFVLAGNFLLALTALLLGVTLLLLLRWPSVWLGTSGLVANVALAAAGILVRGQPLLMIAGSTLALAAWDLGLLEQGLHALNMHPARSFEVRHIQPLALAVGLGLLLAGLGRGLRLQLPFLLVLALVIGALFSLDRVRKHLTGSRWFEPPSQPASQDDLDQDSIE